MRQANALILYDGVRFKKIANGITTTYYVDGGKILGEDRSDGKKLRYFYDKDGILGFRYYNGSYWADNSYVKDGQGNVIGILSNYRYLRAYYEYDAFGATTKVWGEGMDTSAESFIGSINPFRWKGHYYDVETGLYFIEGRFYDPETGTYLNAADAEQIEENAFSPLSLDRNGILCNNILNLIADIYTIFTVLEMNPDPDYDPDANKPWWELAWNAVTKWLAEKISGLMEWYNGIPCLTKAIVGIVLLAVAVGLTLLSHGSLIPIFLTFGTSVGISVFSSVDAARSNGTDMLDGALEGLAEGILWGGIFAFASAVGTYVSKLMAKAKLRKATQAYLDELKSSMTEDQLTKLQFVSGTYDKKLKSMTFGYNSEIPGSSYLNPKLKDIVKRPSCAEVQAINKAINNGSQLKNLYVYTLRVDGKVAYACRDCSIAFGTKVAEFLSPLYWNRRI